MARKGENIYKRKDGRWEGRVLQQNGKYRSFYAKTYRDVRIKMKSNQEQKNSMETATASSRCGAAALFENWLTEGLYGRLKPSTYESYFRCTHKYILPYFRQMENAHLTKEVILRFIKRINANTNLSETYRKKILSIFKTSLGDISKKHHELVHLLQYITLPKASSQKENPVFSVKEQRSIEHVVYHSKNKQVLGILLCFYSGIRIGELCALKWGDIDLEAGVMLISRTVCRIQNFEESTPKTYLHVGSPKSQASLRKIPLPAFLIQRLKEDNISTVNERHYILSGTEEPFDPRAYQRIYKKVLVSSGVPDRKFHAIRHTFATRALELGVDIKTLSEILGHSNINITLNIYAHSLMEQKRIAIEKFNKMYMLNMSIIECAVNSVVTSEAIAL